MFIGLSLGITGTGRAQPQVPAAPSNFVAPSISGSTVRGSTMTVVPGTWGGYPTPTLAYQWKRNGVAISLATNPTYVTVIADEGTTLTVTETATNGSGSASATASGVSIVAQDTTPAAFSFTDLTNQPLSTVTTGAPVTITGINWPTSFSVTGGTVQVNGSGSFVTSGTVNNGDTLTPRVTTSASEATAADCVVTVGGVSDTFTATTADFTPNAFTFTDLTSQALSTVVTGSPVTITGITVAVAFSVTGGAVQVNGTGAFVTSGTVSNGDTLTPQVTTSGTNSTAVNCVVTVGGVSDTFTATTVGGLGPELLAYTHPGGTGWTTSGFNAGGSTVSSDFFSGTPNPSAAILSIDSGETFTVTTTDVYELSSQASANAANVIYRIGEDDLTGTAYAHIYVDLTAGTFTYNNSGGGSQPTVVGTSTVTTVGSEKLIKMRLQFPSAITPQFVAGMAETSPAGSVTVSSFSFKKVI
jgi:hypothetical protein